MKNYKPSKFATIYDPEEDLTEQEHLDSCDINIMIRDANRGLQIRGGKTPQYGEDDTTLSGLDFRIQKQKLEEDLGIIAETHEFTESELQMMPESVRTKFKLKTKAKSPDIKNDDKTTQKKSGKEPSKTEQNDSASNSTIE